MTLTFDLWPLKPFQQRPLSHKMNTCGKFQCYPPTKYRDIASRGIDAWRTTDGQTTNPIFDSAFFVLDSTFWLDSTLIIDPASDLVNLSRNSHSHGEGLCPSVIEIRPPTEQTYIASRGIGVNGCTNNARTDGQMVNWKHKPVTTSNVNRRKRKEGLLPQGQHWPAKHFPRTAYPPNIAATNLRWTEVPLHCWDCRVVSRVWNSSHEFW